MYCNQYSALIIGPPPIKEFTKSYDRAMVHCTFCGNQIANSWIIHCPSVR